VWRLIQAERDRRRANGVRVGANWYHSDDTSRIQQLGLLLMGANMPPGIMWKTMSNTFIEMTPILAQQIFQATGDDLVSSVAQIVLSLCDIPGIQRVIIVVNGQVNEWPKGDGSLTSQPLTAFDFPGRAISSQPAFPAIIKVQAE
jgi:hypothetical protein